MKQVKFIFTALGIVTALSILTGAVTAQTPSDPSATAAQSPAPAPGNITSSTWLTDFAAAQQQAKTARKPMLLDFTGSDWCPWCMKLDQEILATPEFREFANQHLVLVKVDFPMHHAQSAAEQAQNEQLSAKFQVQGYPTVVLLNPDGEEVGSLGYMYGGPKPFIDKLEKIIAD